MAPSRILRNAALGVAGLAAAVGIGLAANTISGDSVGLSAQPLRAGEALAPPAARSSDADRARERRRRQRRARRAASGGDRPVASPPASAAPAPARLPRGTTTAARWNPATTTAETAPAPTDRAPTPAAPDPGRAGQRLERGRLGRRRVRRQLGPRRRRRRLRSGGGVWRFMHACRAKGTTPQSRQDLSRRHGCCSPGPVGYPTRGACVPTVQMGGPKIGQTANACGLGLGKVTRWGQRRPVAWHRRRDRRGLAGVRRGPLLRRGVRRLGTAAPALRADAERPRRRWTSPRSRIA